MSVTLKATPTHVLIHTDGSCIRNPGPGGYAAVLRWMDGETVLRTEIVRGRREDTTNVRMEMLAALRALTALSEFGDDITPAIIVSDSQILVNGAMKWMPNWINRGWKKADGKGVENVKLWQAINLHMLYRPVTFRWVKGHAGDPFNEEVDRLARAEAERACIEAVGEAA
jgi:ribonuclease HI